MDVSVIMVSFNTKELTKKAIKTLQDHCGDLEVEIIMIDNASHDESVAMLKTDFPDIHLIVNEVNVGFGRANNQAIPHLNGDYVLLLNTDAFVAPDSLEKSVQFMKDHPDCGLMGVKLIGRDETLQPSCRYFPTNLNLFASQTGLNRLFRNIRMVDDMDWDHKGMRECDWVPGCYYLMRREVVDQVGLFDPLYFLYYEEVDHCKAIKDAGWKIMYYGDTEVIHIGGESASSLGEIGDVGRQLNELNIESEFLYFRKNHGVFGMMSRAFLASLADLIVLAKRIVKFKRPLGVGVSMKAIAKKWSILVKTNWGQQATR